MLTLPQATQVAAATYLYTKSNIAAFIGFDIKHSRVYQSQTDLNYAIFSFHF